MPPRPSNHFHSPLLFRAAAAVLPEHLLCAFHLLQGFECRRLKFPEIPNAAISSSEFCRRGSHSRSELPKAAQRVGQSRAGPRPFRGPRPPAVPLHAGTNRSGSAASLPADGFSRGSPGPPTRHTPSPSHSCLWALAAHWGHSQAFETESFL